MKLESVEKEQHYDVAISHPEFMIIYFLFSNSWEIIIAI